MLVKTSDYFICWHFDGRYACMLYRFAARRLAAQLTVQIGRLLSSWVTTVYRVPSGLTSVTVVIRHISQDWDTAGENLRSSTYGPPCTARRTTCPRRRLSFCGKLHRCIRDRILYTRSSRLVTHFACRMGMGWRKSCRFSGNPVAVEKPSLCDYRGHGKGCCRTSPMGMEKLRRIPTAWRCVLL